MLQFMRVKADAQDGLLEKYAANVDYGSEEMVLAEADALQQWVRANCAGIAWVELIRHVEYRALKDAGFAADEEDWELSILFNDPADAEKFGQAFTVVDRFSAE
ncbi:hypothetical protein [Ramlibacter alkalitolerans]|uniref:Uncharacterized protein n=1 Tax=Ramlibacter alkalitolerans TaxID=2039631 RepID=A0ABS1JH25_9BURK|nr:hypothetical protein [Ramlibacter alkalitolerans]MBL0423524.1 hypothetical protein [Ramlibacter alkalitolerans]